MLAEMERWVDDFPPIAQPMRFGNKAFRQWHARLCEKGEGLLADALRRAPAATAEQVGPLSTELAYYLRGSFGDERRIDYGTGHEVAFLAILFALGSTGILARSDAADAVLVVFADYIRLMRRLQKVYMLEPAGLCS
ncbi:PTPA [Symbiodinium natans]|uniref:Serine/threonine-protein phosphatase 2A activator n=1 Tax=Symbiodinium natans TaxID=878477 RepID=A0A812ICM8_9DINO|nr:PTPA [Symbiodinium natans]